MTERAMITHPDDYFIKGCGRCARFDTPECSARRWLDGIKALREICLDAGLDETAKWGHPVYMFAGRNIAMIGAFQGDFTFTFLNASLLEDPEKLLEIPGPNSQVASLIRFSDSQKVLELKPIIRAYLLEAMDYAARGIKPKKTERALELPDEFIDALDDDPEMAEAFHALTPGRQRSYMIALSSAKKSETRIARIAKFRDKIIDGKGALER